MKTKRKVVSDVGHRIKPTTVGSAGAPKVAKTAKTVPAKKRDSSFDVSAKGRKAAISPPPLPAAEQPRQQPIYERLSPNDPFFTAHIENDPEFRKREGLPPIDNEPLEWNHY